MAETASSSANVEPVQVGPLQTVTSNANETQPATALLQEFKDVTIDTSNVAPPATNGTNSTRSGSATKGPRVGLHLGADAEKNIREVMAKARIVANGGDNPFTTEEDIKDLAVVTNSLLRLLNAAYIATDTVVRGVGYMQGATNPHPKTALAFARRDRRTQMEAQQALAQVGPQAGPQGFQAIPEQDAKDTAEITNVSHGTEVGPTTGSNNENAAPGTDGQQQNSAASQAKPKKKRFWQSRRNSRKGKTNVNSKPQVDKVQGQTDGAAEGNGSADDKRTAKVDMPQTSGSNTAAEETVGDDGVVAAAKA